jgi:hypothetical protein
LPPKWKEEIFRIECKENRKNGGILRKAFGPEAPDLQQGWANAATGKANQDT